MMNVTAGALISLRAANRDRVTELLRTVGPMHRAALARETGLSRTTISAIVGELIEAGLVIDDTSPGNSRTARGSKVRLDPRASLIAGVDIGRDVVRGVLSDMSHEAVAWDSADLVGAVTWQDQLSVAVELLEKLTLQAGTAVSRLRGVGLGVPGPVDVRTGIVGASSNSGDWVGVPAGARLGEQVHIPVAVDNTSHLGSLAEVVWGGARGLKNVLYVKVSSGIGAGMVLGGRVYRGAHGVAGELGHATLNEDGPLCRCGNRGCLEVYASARAVQDALRPTFDDVSMDILIERCRAGEKPFCRAVADAGLRIGRIVAGVCNLLNPDAVVVGGELARTGEHLIESIRTSIERHGLAVVTEELSVVASQLGDHGGALGGVALVLHESERLVTAG